MQRTERTAKITAILWPLLIAGCALPGKISSEMQMPPKNADAAKLRSIAILRFDASGHRDITPDLEAALTTVSYEGKPYFTVVERRRLDDAIREMRLGETGALNPATAAKLGQMIAAKGVYMGAITRDEVADQRYTEPRRACAEVQLVRDKNGALQEGPCVRYQEIVVGCTRRNANFEFVPKLVDVAQGTVVYSRAIATNDTRTVCQGDHVPLPLPEDMRRQLRVAAINVFREDVAPYTKPVQIAYLRSTDGITNPAVKEKFESSLAFAGSNRLDRACEVWTELAKAEATSAAIVFNTGACAEVAGDFARAGQLYAAADRLLTKPDSTVSESLRRIKERQAAEARRPGGPVTTGHAVASASIVPTVATQPSQERGTAGSATVPAPQAAALVLDKTTVVQAQAKLNAAGYAVGTPDGSIGPRTKAAIRKFQADHRLAATGDLDAATVRALGLN